MLAARHGKTLLSCTSPASSSIVSVLFFATSGALLLVLMAPTGAMALPMQDHLHRETPDFLKRAGFVGMRGKKSTPSLDEAGAESESWLLDDDDMSDLLRKRAGFVGMRGKKMNGGGQQNNAWAAQLLNKRAGFVGMRGKKAGSSEESAWKRAGFVGMRGKKSESEPAYFMEAPSGMEAGALLPLDWANQISGMKTRRGSSGFVGMRG